MRARAAPARSMSIQVVDTSSAVGVWNPGFVGTLRVRCDDGVAGLLEGECRPPPPAPVRPAGAHTRGLWGVGCYSRGSKERDRGEKGGGRAGGRPAAAGGGRTAGERLAAGGVNRIPLRTSLPFFIGIRRRRGVIGGIWPTNRIKAGEPCWGICPSVCPRRDPPDWLPLLTGFRLRGVRPSVGILLRREP